MERKLFEEKEILTQRFLERNQLANLDDERVLQVLQREIELLQGKEYEEVQDKLVEIAAIYGELIIESMGGEWEYRNEKTYVENVPLCPQIIVLSDVALSWGMDDVATMIQTYIYLLVGLYQYIDYGRRTYGSDWIPPKQYRGLIDMKKLDSRRQWAIHIVERYGADIEGDESIRTF